MAISRDYVLGLCGDRTFQNPVVRFGFKNVEGGLWTKFEGSETVTGTHVRFIERLLYDKIIRGRQGCVNLAVHPTGRKRSR